jgi:hypothetical protein
MPRKVVKHCFIYVYPRLRIARIPQHIAKAQPASQINPFDQRIEISEKSDQTRPAIMCGESQSVPLGKTTVR